MLAMLIAIMLIVGLFPVMTFADGTANAGDGEYVYLSISFDKHYIKDKNGSPMVYVPVALADIAAVDLTEYGLENMLYDADGDGNYETTALQLLIYAHEELYGGEWSEVTFDALPGSSYFKGGIFGFTENLVYFLNGDFPVDESQASDFMTVGATSDRIVLEAGDFLDVASFECYQFLWDQLGGFHLFADEDGNYVHDYTVEAGEALTVKLKHSFCDLMFGESWVKDAADFEIFYGSVYGEALGTVMTDDEGNAEITFPTAGTYYVWSEGGNGADDGWTHTSCDHYNETYEPCVVSSPAYAKVTVTGETGHTCADGNKDHVCDNGCDQPCGTCEDKNDDHKCDYGCDKPYGTCADANKDHVCDYGCDKPYGTCEDKNNDHKCDYGCTKTYGTCADADKDHKCDYGCDQPCGTCADADKDHTCDYGCGESYGTCEDKNNDHKCDYGCDKPYGTCADANKDHICDYGCGKPYGTCEDKNNDHKCDCGCDKPYGTCEDKNNDHKCDYGCGKAYGTCEDKNNDHKCDYGCTKFYGSCEDKDKNHVCDGCGGSVGDHADGYHKDHVCDWCNASISVCNDANRDHGCDVCGVSMGEHRASEGAHACGYCGQTLSSCRDTDRNGRCDVCGSIMSVEDYIQAFGNQVTGTVENVKDMILDAPEKIAQELGDYWDANGEDIIRGTVSGVVWICKSAKVVLVDYLEIDIKISFNLK